MVERQRLAQLPDAYVVQTADWQGQQFLLAASEARQGACLLFTADGQQLPNIWDAPGGCMALLPLPGAAPRLLAIQGFFPIFQSAQAEIVIGHAAQPQGAWQFETLVKVPYAHRIECLQSGDRSWLVAATLCASKAFPDDWSSPGAVLASPLASAADHCWQPMTVLAGLTRNHGMCRGAWQGRQGLLIAAEQGLWWLPCPTAATADQWAPHQLLQTPTSDAGLIDQATAPPLLVTIEPFHGDRLVIRRQQPGCGWEVTAEMPLNFGHALWAGIVAGQRLVLVGNRGGDRDLCLLTLCEAGRILTTQRLDAGGAPAQAICTFANGRLHILSANHAAGEVVRYTLSCRP